MLKFLYNEPAAIFGEWLIISDLHIGKETGVNWKASARIVHELMEREQKKKLLVLGDVKATIASTEGDAGKFIREMGSDYDLHITKGNHDGNIEKYHGYCTVYGPEGAVIYDDGRIRPGNEEVVIGEGHKGKITGCGQGRCIGALHGHAWPGEELLRCKTMIIGHAHPKMVFGKVWKRAEKVWMVGKLDAKALREHYGKGAKICRGIRLVCMPAFGPYAGASDSKEGFGPLLKNTFIKRAAEIYLLNGIQLK
jgi:metallophosphoesterase superfamily enzyme